MLRNNHLSCIALVGWIVPDVVLILSTEAEPTERIGPIRVLI